MNRAQTPRAGAALTATVALALTLVGCAAEPQAEQPTPTAPATAPSASASTAPSQEPATETEKPVADPTCKTLIIESVVQTLTSTGAEAREEPFMIGSTEIEGGLLCRWGIFGDGDAGGAQLYGWAPIDTETAARAADTLEKQGWLREAGEGDGFFITENPDTIVIADEDGYGMTYQFGDGWVTVSETKLGLQLIQIPS